MKKSKKPVVNTKTLGINMPKSLFSELEKRAKAQGVSKSLYCKTVLRMFVASGEVLKV